MVGQIQEADDEDGLTELGEGLIFGSWMLEPTKVNDGDGLEGHGEGREVEVVAGRRMRGIDLLLVLLLQPRLYNHDS